MSYLAPALIGSGKNRRDAFTHLRQAIFVKIYSLQPLVVAVISLNAVYVFYPLVKGKRYEKDHFLLTLMNFL